jgi:hypothetical protein
VTPSEEELIEEVFPEISENYKDSQWLGARAILAPTGHDVNVMNLSVQDELKGEKTTISLFILCRKN